MNLKIANIILWSAVTACCLIIHEPDCLAQGNARLEISPDQPDETETKELEGVVVDRKKYSIVVRSGDEVHEVGIPNGTEIVLKMNRPLIDFKKNTISVARDGATPIVRAEFPFSGPLFLNAKFAHEQQYQRIMHEDPKRLGNYTVSAKATAAHRTPDTGTDKYSIAGELLPGSSIREFLLRTDKQQYQVILGPGGRLAGQTVLSLEPGSTFVKLVCETNGSRLTAREIEFWPVTPIDAARQSNKK